MKQRIIPYFGKLENEDIIFVHSRERDHLIHLWSGDEYTTKNFACLYTTGGDIVDVICLSSI